MNRFWKRLVLGGAASLILLPVLGLLIETQVTRVRGQRRLAAAVAALDASDPAWRMDPLTAARNHDLPLPDENAAEVALKATTYIPASYKEWGKDVLSRGELADALPHLPDESSVCGAMAVIDDCDDALALARTVHKYPRGGFRVVFATPNPYATLIPHIQEMREAATLLDVDALVLAYQGHGDAAIRSAHAIVGVARSIGDDPFLIAQLVRIAAGMVARNAAERTLAWCEPRAGLAELQAAFLQEAAANRMTPGLKGERAASFMVLQAVDAGLVGLNELEGGPSRSRTYLDRAGVFALRKYIPGQQADLLDLFDKYLQADRLSGPARRAAVDAIALPPRSFSTAFVYLLFPAIQKVVEADDRARASLGAAAVGIACERYRQRFGRWPATLAAIPKDILPLVPDDPYTGGPLRYAVFPDGVAVYAAGPDKTDDGGKTLNQSGKPGTDLGFRLWNPDKRRQPPKPKPPEDGDPNVPIDDGPGAGP